MKYLKGDYVKFICNYTDQHQRAMLDAEKVSEEYVKTLEIIGRIINVIDYVSYMVVTARPFAGYKVVIDYNDVVRKLSEDEVSDFDELCSVNVNYIGLRVYISEDEPKGSEVKEKCLCLVEQAMNSLFPEEAIESTRIVRSDFLKLDLLKSVDRCLDRHVNKNDVVKFTELKEKRDAFEGMLKRKRFKEYLTLMISTEGNHNYLAVVCTDYKEVVVLRDKGELTSFVDSLGPEYADVYRQKQDFFQEILINENR